MINVCISLHETGIKVMRYLGGKNVQQHSGIAPYTGILNITELQLLQELREGQRSECGLRGFFWLGLDFLLVLEAFRLFLVTTVSPNGEPQQSCPSPGRFPDPWRCCPRRSCKNPTGDDPKLRPWASSRGASLILVVQL